MPKKKESIGCLGSLVLLGFLFALSQHPLDRIRAFWHRHSTLDQVRTVTGRRRKFDGGTPTYYLVSRDSVLMKAWVCEVDAGTYYNRERLETVYSEEEPPRVPGESLSEALRHRDEYVSTHAYVPGASDIEAGREQAMCSWYEAVEIPIN